MAKGLVGENAVISRRIRVLGVVWVCVSLPVITAVSAFVHSPGGYRFVLVFMACGAYTTPALAAGWYAMRRVLPHDRMATKLLLCSLCIAYAIGVASLVGLATGWNWANGAGVPAVALTGALKMTGLVLLLRSRSGRRALSVDVIEAVTSTVAVTAPLVVLWGPAVVDARASWFTLPCAVATVGAIAGTYWTVVLFVRLGPGRGIFATGAVVMAAVGVLNAALQTAQGVSGFTLPAPPLIALNAACFSMYLFIPLNVPLLLPAGLGRLPLQSQVRGVRLATVITLAGLVALWVATYLVVDVRPWALPFAFAVLSLLLVLGGLRQLAAAQEARRLYRQIEEASDERRQLLTQLLERSVHDRRRFAGQLYEQAIAAYASFSLMAGSEAMDFRTPSVVAQVSARVGGDLARQAESVRELVLVIRPLEGEPNKRERLGIPIRAYLATVYGDRMAPRLTVGVDDELALDWMTETVLLQIVQEALDNVGQHSRATTVDVGIQAAGERVALRVTDDGVGFDAASAPEGSGLATMRAAVAVTGGTLVVGSRPGEGTTILAHLGPDRSPAPAPPALPPSPPSLRIVPSG